MVDISKAIVVKFSSHGENFEILVDCESALKLKQGKPVSMQDVLAVDKVYSNARKGLLASQNKIKQAFGTDDIDEIAKAIIMRWDVPLTAELRKKLVEEKRKRILAYIQKNGVDPRTHVPHPLARLEMAFEEAKIKVDEHTPETEQIKEIIKKLLPILPIVFEKKQIEILLPPQYVKAYQTIKRLGTIRSEQWISDGSWKGVLEFPAGMQDEVYDAINKSTHGNAETKLINIVK